MVVVTGAAGFIGSNLVEALNRQGVTDILAVDDLTDGHKFRNLADLTIADYLDKDDFEAELARGLLRDVMPEVVYHQGARAKTTDWDGRAMMRDNYRSSRRVLDACQAAGVPLVYASTAAVYGATRSFREDPADEGPLNVYGYSKLAFDQHVRSRLAGFTAPVVGLRYFNVYGPREQHKGGMASVAFHHFHQLGSGDAVRLFAGSDGYGDGEQRRDFVAVRDVVEVVLWFGANPKSGVYNCGTGRSQPFNDVARAVIGALGRGRIEYVPFPQELVGTYQSYTQADLTNLRAAGYTGAFRDVATGVAEYVTWLSARG